MKEEKYLFENDNKIRFEILRKQWKNNVFYSSSIMPTYLLFTLSFLIFVTSIILLIYLPIEFLTRIIISILGAITTIIPIFIGKRIIEKARIHYSLPFCTIINPKLQIFEDTLVYSYYEGNAKLSNILFPIHVKLNPENLIKIEFYKENIKYFSLGENDDFATIFGSGIKTSYIDKAQNVSEIKTFTMILPFCNCKEALTSWIKGVDNEKR